MKNSAVVAALDKLVSLQKKTIGVLGSSHTEISLTEIYASGATICSLPVTDIILSSVAIELCRVKKLLDAYAGDLTNSEIDTTITNICNHMALLYTELLRKRGQDQCIAH